MRLDKSAPRPNIDSNVYKGGHQSLGHSVFRVWGNEEKGIGSQDCHSPVTIS